MEMTRPPSRMAFTAARILATTPVTLIFENDALPDSRLVMWIVGHICSNRMMCLYTWCIAVSDCRRSRSRDGSGVGYSRLRWNDRGDLFWNLFYPSIFLCDHEDFCQGAQEEAPNLNRASSTERESCSWKRWLLDRNLWPLATQQPWRTIFPIGVVIPS